MHSWPTQRSHCNCRPVKGSKSRFPRLCMQASQSSRLAQVAYHCKFNMASRAICATLAIMIESRATFMTFTRTRNSTKLCPVSHVKTSQMKSAQSVMLPRGSTLRSCIPAVRRSNHTGSGSTICCAKRRASRTRRASRSCRAAGWMYWVEYEVWDVRFFWLRALK